MIQLMDRNDIIRAKVDCLSSDIPAIQADLELDVIFPGAVVTSHIAFSPDPLTGPEIWVEVWLKPEHLTHQSTFYAVCQRVINYNEEKGDAWFCSMNLAGGYPILVDGTTHELFYFTAGSYIWKKAKTEGIKLTFRFIKYKLREVSE